MKRTLSQFKSKFILLMIEYDLSFIISYLSLDLTL